MLGIGPRALKMIGRCSINMLISLATFKLFSYAEYNILLKHQVPELYISSIQFIWHVKSCYIIHAKVSMILYLSVPFLPPF